MTCAEELKGIDYFFLIFFFIIESRMLKFDMRVYVKLKFLNILFMRIFQFSA